jgi:hypothetical protein
MAMRRDQAPPTLGKESPVKAKLVGILTVAVLGLSAGTAEAATTPNANVDNIAVVASAVTVVFEFDLYDCPAGAEIAVVDWTAKQPSRPDSGAAGGFQPYGLSNGDHVQRLVLEVGASSFLPGETWVGTGTIACGTVLIPVAVSGQTRSPSGV